MSAYRGHRVDRATTCPFLVRVFYKEGGSFEKSEFIDYNHPPEKEFQFYTWKDATLRELTELLKEVNELTRQRDTTIYYKIAYPTRSGELKLDSLGSVNSTRFGSDDRLNLETMKFAVGDFLVAEIHPHKAQNYQRLPGDRSSVPEPQSAPVEAQSN